MSPNIIKSHLDMDCVVSPDRANFAITESAINSTVHTHCTCIVQ